MPSRTLSRGWRWFSLLFGCALPALVCVAFLWHAWITPDSHGESGQPLPFEGPIGFLCSLPALFLALSGPVCARALVCADAMAERTRFLERWLNLSTGISSALALLLGLGLLIMASNPAQSDQAPWSSTAMLFASALLCAWVHFKTAERLRALATAGAEAATSA